jgi:hypothetical protein
MNPAWRMIDPEGEHIATLAFPRLEDAVIHLYLRVGELEAMLDRVRAAAECEGEA